MRQFIAGFVVGLLSVVPPLVSLLRKKFSCRNQIQRNADLKSDNTGDDKKSHLNELEELGRLVGELAHEIKNPLSTIKVNLKLIAEELAGSGFDTSAPAGDQRLRRVVRKIDIVEKEADRLEQILNDFLRYVDGGKLQLSRVDINELVGNMVDFYSPQAHSHSITIRVGLHNKALICKIDTDMLKQVLLNLFINAQQAMGDGGELMIKTASEKDNAVIRISDTGCGIAADKLSSVFKAYYSSRPQGTGLGLPTVKKIIEAHNGTIDVASEPGKGTLFTIKLPLSEEG